MTTSTPNAIAPINAKTMVWTLVGSIVLTLLLYYVIPYGHFIAYPLTLFSTWAHEMGHGVAAELVGGEFARFEMWSDGSGVAYSRIPDSGLNRAFTAFGGLVGPAIASLALFVLASKPRLARVGLGLLAFACLLSVVLVVRNVFGVVFVSSFGLIFAAMAYYGNDRVAHFGLVFMAVQLALAVFSRADYLFTDVAQTSAGAHPSDVAQISEALIGPYWFWGGLIALLSAGIIALGLWLFYRSALAIQQRSSTAPAQLA